MEDKSLIRHTEQSSHYRHLERMNTMDLLSNMNKEDHTVPEAIEKVLPAIARLTEAIYEKLNAGGRLFYIGAGTSGRLGVVDASECPPTFGVPHGMVIGLIAGGDSAIRKAVEFAEDDTALAWKDLSEHSISSKDIVVGIAASGTTPYVVNGLKLCRENNIATGSIACNANTPISQQSDHPIEVIVGPEFVTGSTRMKAGTAQKLILNMLTTSVMIKLGHVVDNKMVDMQLSNDKLVDRGTHLIVDSTDLDYSAAKSLLLEHGSVRSALAAYQISRS